ncbi:heptaprenylglyceryl phosphate synthase [Paenibacillus lutrae]|uniref:Heptaprenylglyceryl phosphate synthase n=1 Tax=Paenibacillus lutrae TaxID=2078573 RepID=A0A7X3K0Z6_9BACL|nr:heptaprenylglyceryl phosphate synthase [Paenibacillus lutrae]MVP01612.1 heptaprenylglyceryl phosphate synthase [Paenibacillus lutrae]
MIVDSSKWKHVFKLDPDKEISDESLDRICLSGTDAIIVGGSSGVTFDNTVDLLSRIRGYEVPCVLEVSDSEAIVPGFDLFFIPMVLNAEDPDWILGRHHEAIKEYGAMMDWNEILVEGYVILHADSTAAKITRARTGLSERDVQAYARMAEHLLHLPIFYIEYSGTFGDMDLIRSTKRVLETTRLFYGGGIDGPEKARMAAEAADTIVVGNLIYEDLERALETVQALI